jgi:hypothetical protein
MINYITLFITAIETCGFSFSLLFKFFGETHAKQLKGEFSAVACLV